MLHPGLIVLTSRGPVELRGRNGCHRWMWWGWPIRNGRPLKNHTWVGTARDVLAVRVEYGFQTVLPGYLEVACPN